MNNCKRCSICCRRMVIPAEHYDIDTVRMRKNFKKLVKYNDKTYFVFESTCRYVTYGDICRIYRNRPPMCKMFPTEDTKELWRTVNPDCGMVQEVKE